MYAILEKSSNALKIKNFNNIFDSVLIFYKIYNASEQSFQKLILIDYFAVLCHALVYKTYGTKFLLVIYFTKLF